MDDLYGNLENYNEEKIIQELRNENSELKSKIQEYSDSMDKLQKDFDKLTTEFKTLEMNYSSLLKTAKAEIERKTQIITNLNIEKDQMVLNSLQNGNGRKRFWNKNLMTTNKADGNEAKRKDKEKTIEEENTDKIKKKESLKDGNKKPSNDKSRSAVSSIDNKTTLRSTDNLQNTKLTESIALNDKKNSESKENIAHKDAQKDDKKMLRASSIKNRRKSMPVSLNIEAIKADEEYLERYRDRSQNDLIRDEKYDRNYVHEQNYTSEVYNMDDRYSDRYSGYSEPSREYKQNRYYDHDRYRNRDREFSYKHKRYSPDRYQRREYREYNDRRSQKFDYSRERVLESPPPDIYSHQFRNNENKYDRNAYNQNRSYNYRQERNATKHKAPYDYEESKSKRQKTESYSKHDARKWGHELEFSENESIPGSVDDMRFISCQSPDFASPNSMSTQPIKEIKNIATTELEDPRVVSRNYMVKTSDDKVILSAVTGRHVDLKVVPKSSWNIETVEIPKALSQRPSQLSSNFVKEINVDIDNASKHVSGTFYNTQFETEELDRELCQERGKVKNNYKEKLDKRKNDEEPLNSIAQDENSPKTIFSSSKVPIVKHTETKHEKTDNEVVSLSVSSKSFPTKDDKKVEKVSHSNDETYKSSTNRVSHKHDSYSHKNRDILKIKKDKVKTRQEIVERDLELSDENSDNIDLLMNIQGEYDSEIPCNIKKPDSQDTLANSVCSKKPIIEESLTEIKHKTTKASKSSVLSDQTTVTSTKEKLKNKDHDRKHSTAEQTSTEIKNNVNINKSSTASDNADSSKAEKAKNKENNKKHSVLKAPSTEREPRTATVSKNNEKEETIKSKDDRKQKGKRSYKHKEDKPKELLGSAESRKDKKSMSKEDKGTDIQPNQTEIRNKFSDLFGDSGSLITPEDLGIPAAQSQIGTSGEYATVIEDALDANDMNLDQIAKVQKSSEIKNAATNDAIESFTSDSKMTTKIDKVNEVNQVINERKNTPRHDIEEQTTEALPNIIAVYENLNVDTAEKDVVKTVIISKGVQPSCVPIVSQPITDNVIPYNDTENKDVTMPKKQLVLMKALATSTPHKDHQQNIAGADLESGVTDFSNASKNLISDSSTATNTPDHSESNALQPHDADAPDVRIFVRRRRRVIKKP